MQNDDLGGIPDVDLAPVIQDLEKQGNQDQPLVEDQTTKKDDDAYLAQFQNPKELLKGYKEVQGWATRLSQEAKEKDARLAQMEADMAQLREQAELYSYPASAAPAQHTPPGAQPYSWEERFAAAPQDAISQMVAESVRKERMSDAYQQIMAENPADFQERLFFANEVSKKAPHLAGTPDGLKKLFEVGDKMRAQAVKTNARKSLEAILGEPVDDEKIAKMRALIGANANAKAQEGKTQTANNAYMPDTGMSFATGADTRNTTDYSRIRAEAEQKGDVDTVIDSLIREALESG